MLNDSLIRSYLKLFIEQLVDEAHEIVEELSISDKQARVDIAVLGSKLYSFEIKSDVDTLNRLSNQVKHYDYVFEENYAVTTTKHYEKLKRKIPKHWGIICAQECRLNGVSFKVKRKARENPNWDIHSALATLWKSELAEIYEKTLDKNPPKSLNRKELIFDLSISESKTMKTFFRESLLQRTVKKKAFLEQNPA